MKIFCSIFHRWSDWMETDTNIQYRWCQDCNYKQRKLVKLKGSR